MNKESQFHIDETLKHRESVKKYLYIISKILESRGRSHDESKLHDPEQSVFVEYAPKLKISTYGSDEYKTFLKEMKPALDNHYKMNMHHPEHYEDGIKEMTLISLLEMLFDWVAAAERHANGDIFKSIEVNKQRFGYDDLLAQIFTNTVEYMSDTTNKEVSRAIYEVDQPTIKIPPTGIGDMSDGYHTFNELYHHRAILFSVICNQNREKAWKSMKHADGSMYDDMFIVGIETPLGPYTYHYNIEPYWKLFNVVSLETAPEWDGHQPDDVDRLLSLRYSSPGKPISIKNKEER